MRKLLLVVFLLGAFAGAQTPRVGPPGGQLKPPMPAPPKVYVDTTWNPPTGGFTWRAHTSADLGNALISSAPGDIIVLDAGMTYTGNFRLSAKVNPGGRWIYIQSSSLTKLPLPGTRVNPLSDAPNMPRIVSPNANPAITLAPGANHYRLVGLEVTTTSNQGCNLGNL